MTFCVVAKTFYCSVAVCHHLCSRRCRIAGFVELSNVIQSGRNRSSDEHFKNELKDEQTKILSKWNIKLIFAILKLKQKARLWNYTRI